MKAFFEKSYSQFFFGTNTQNNYDNTILHYDFKNLTSFYEKAGLMAITSDFRESWSPLNVLQPIPVPNGVDSPVP